MLNREEIIRLIKEKKLVEGYIDLQTQVTPNGFDLTVSSIYGFKGAGALDFSNKERSVPEAGEILPEKIKRQDRFGWWKLKKGVYKIKTNEIINLPNDLIALSFSRTSILRMGVSTQHGVWDAGFCGRGEFLLIVENNKGIKIKQNARIAQLIFARINATARGYEGAYKNL
jgi:dUTP pyrophosphatase